MLTATLNAYSYIASDESVVCAFIDIYMREIFEVAFAAYKTKVLPPYSKLSFYFLLHCMLLT